MEKDVELTCRKCNKRFLRAAKEVRRSKKLGRKHYCSSTCAAVDRENQRARDRRVSKKCPICNTVFESRTKKKASRFCSRVCAIKSRSIVTE